MSKALIDVDLYLFRSATKGELETEWQPEVWTYVCDHSIAKNAFLDCMDWVRDTLPDHQPVLCFGSKTNFRYSFWPSYKSNRRGKRRPAGYKQLRAWAADIWESLEFDSLEGDDVIGVSYEEGDVIVSGDKDLLTIPGLHLRDDGTLLESSQADADRRFYIQALAGDATDGYPGCPGLGVVRAERMLEDCTTELEMWNVVLAAYEKAKKDQDYAVAMARCARILRAGEYRDGRAQPWNPPVT